MDESEVTNNVADPLNQQQVPEDVLAGLLKSYDEGLGLDITVESLGEGAKDPVLVAEVAKMRMARLLDTALTGLAESCGAKAESVKFNACKFVIEQNLVAGTDSAAKSPWEQLLERMSDGDQTLEKPIENPNE